jgi:hypothetical protein
MMGFGSTANSTGKAFSLKLMVLRERASGIAEEILIGLTD